jgi:gluconate 2-dehydrogenase gamma chain
MSEITRREMFSRLALTIAAAGTVDRLPAEEIHRVVQQAATASGGRYLPKALSSHDFQTLERVTDLIIPADGSKPGALQADVAAWIDTLLNVNSELQSRYSSGLAWLDARMKTRGASDFLTATPAQQAGLLDEIAYQRNRSEELNPGIDFFILARRMTVDGFYTSPLGMRDVYMGNSPQAAFTVPAASMDHVLGRSPLK